MNIFFLQWVWNIGFIDENEFKTNLEKIWIKNKIINIFWLKWVYIDKKNIKDILPLINGMLWKYYFIDSSILDNNIILWVNIFDIEHNEKKIKNITKKIEYIKKEINSDKLITNSKKEEYANIIKESIYLIAVFLIKTYFLITSAIKNKQELEKIINNSSSLEEFKAHAYLIKTIWFEKIELLSTRFEIILKQLQFYTQIMDKYFKNYIK